MEKSKLWFKTTKFLWNLSSFTGSFQIWLKLLILIESSELWLKALNFESNFKALIESSEIPLETLNFTLESSDLDWKLKILI